jgi:hypothetical protein
MRKLVGLVVAIVASCFAMPLLGAAAIFGGGSCTPVIAGPSPSQLPVVDGFDTEQVSNAAVIITVGNARGAPQWGWVVAVATALQESGLRNLAGGDRDSIGLFQQRPSQGWGTPQQLADPAYQAARFFDKLLTIDSWRQMPLTDAAQAVQQSAYPDAYAKWTTDAIHLVSLVGSGTSGSIPASVGPCLPVCPQISSSGGSPSPDSGCVGGEAVLARAATWLTAWGGGPVPYMSNGDPDIWSSGYRRDCSGYASMALGLPGPGLNTDELAAQSTPIPKEALHPGDLLINPAPGGTGHVVIFDRWTNEAMTGYVAYEQSGDGGTHHRVIPYPYFDGYPMSPYRFGTG